MGKKTMRVILRSLLIVTMCSGSARGGSRVTDVQVTAREDAVEIAIVCDSVVTYRAFTEKNPPRIAINIEDARHRVPNKIIPVNVPPVFRVRSDQFRFRPSRVTRVVADLTEPRPYTVDVVEGMVLLRIERTPEDRDEPEMDRAIPDSSEFGRTPSSDVSKLSIRLQDVRLEDALKLITKKTGMNFLYKPELADRKVNLFLRDVSLHEALSVMLQAHGLWYEQQEGTDLYVVREGDPVPIVEFVTEVIRCQYAAVEDLGLIVEGNLTQEGRVQSDERSNSFIVTDVPEAIAMVKMILSHLDRPKQQVLIEAKIMQVVLRDQYKLGIDWQFVAKKMDGLSVTSQFRILPAGEGTTLTSGVLARDDYTTLLEMLEEVGKVNVLSTPRITVTDGTKAKILVGSTIPYKTVDSRESDGVLSRFEKVTMVDVGVKLYVTPHISHEGFIQMHVQPEVSSSLTSVDGIPVVETSQAETDVLVKDGASIIIAGLIKDDVKETVKGIPLISRIPLLGRLFSSTEWTKEKTELAIFMTCRIVSGEGVMSGNVSDVREIGGVSEE